MPHDISQTQNTALSKTLNVGRSDRGDNGEARRAPTTAAADYLVPKVPHANRRNIRKSAKVARRP